MMEQAGIQSNAPYLKQQRASSSEDRGGSQRDSGGSYLAASNILIR